MATTTPNFGWPIPTNPDPATIPEDMLTFAVPVDAAIKELSDRVEAQESVYIAHDGDGAYSFQNGLGAPVAVEAGVDGDWQVLA